MRRESYARHVVTSSESVLIGRPPAEVFAFTCNLSQEHRWDTEIDDVSCDEQSPLEVGRPYRARFKPFLAESEGTVTPLELVPGERVVLQAEFAGLISRISYTFTEVEHGTRFTREVTVVPAGMLRLVSPFVTRRVRRSNRRDVLNLKRVLEAS